jgi:16S rRNA (cytosine967-C5)-methyltransferase
MEVLSRAEKKKGFIDNILELTLRRHRLPERDERFVREITYGVTKLRKHLDYVLTQFANKKKEKLAAREVLRIGAYQILFMDRVPDYAAINESVKLLKAEASGLTGFVNAVLRRLVQERDRIVFPDPRKKPASFLSTFYSHPEWLIQRWLQRYGYEQTEQLCRFNNTAAQLCVRTNTLRVSPQQLCAVFEKERVEATRGRYVDSAYYLKVGAPVAQLPSFQKGFFQIQDESAVLVGKLLNARPTERIVDLCASPGGKSTHLAQATKDAAFIVAVDVSLHRLKPLIQNVKRLRIQSIHPVVSDSRYFRTRNCDAVLLDVPCSGTGTLRRRADLRWRRKQDDIKTLQSLQSELLDNAGSMLKAGGRLIYSTCSIEPDENETVIDRFLSDHSNFSLLPIPKGFQQELVRDGHYLVTLPHVHKIDGIFACLLLKN